MCQEMLNNFITRIVTREGYSEDSINECIVRSMFQERFIKQYNTFDNKQLSMNVCQTFKKKETSVIACFSKMMQNEIFKDFIDSEKELQILGPPKWVHKYNSSIMRIVNKTDKDLTDLIEISPEELADIIPPEPEPVNIIEETIIEEPIVEEVIVEEVIVEEPIIEEAVEKKPELDLKPLTKHMNLDYSQTTLNKFEHFNKLEMSEEEIVMNKYQPHIKAVLLGSFPQEIHRLHKEAKKLNVTLKVFAKNNINMGSPDLIIICTSCASHKYQDVAKQHKEYCDIRYLNTCNKNAFRALIQEYRKEKFKPEEVVKITSPKPEVQVTINETPKLDPQEGIYSIPENPEPETVNIIPDNLIKNNILKDNIIYDEVPEEPKNMNQAKILFKPIKKECLIEYILDECKKDLEAAVKRAKDQLSQLDIYSGKVQVNCENNRFELSLTFKK